jgi:cytochrome c biogenesis protein ResB
MKTKKSKTWFVSIIIFILFGLLSCTKEKYPNKMDSIAKALSKIKK